MPNRRNDVGEASLSEFLEGLSDDNSLRIEEDFGHGFVRLKSSEAERRQAAQDIRTSEDVVIELLRNSRDAGAKNIYVSTGRTGDLRSIVVIDDGDGIPEKMRDLVFEPRITSKLDSAHMDKWGFHGRGMALFSIAENALDHEVVYSSVGDGTSIKVTLSSSSVGEKKDQSTFPEFEVLDGVFQMRGPKNIQRTICEFAIESRNEVNVYLGSNTEIAATLYSDGLKEVPAKERIFSTKTTRLGPAELMSYANDPVTFKDIAGKLGLDISERSARRVMDKDIVRLDSMFQRVEQGLSMGSDRNGAPEEGNTSPIFKDVRRHLRPHITRPDMREFEKSVSEAYAALSEKYFLDGDVTPKVRIKKGKLSVEFDLIDKS